MTKRLTRSICAIAAASVSVALAVITGCAWAVSWDHALQTERRVIQDPLDRERLGAEAYCKSGIYSYHGRIVYAVTACNGFDLSMCGSERVLLNLDAIARRRPFGTARDEGHTFRAWYWHREVWIPHWCLVLALGIHPTVFALIRAARKRDGRDGGKCARCGYDLRATPDRCPECGTVPTTKVARPAGPVEESAPGPPAQYSAGWRRYSSVSFRNEPRPPRA